NKWPLGVAERELHADHLRVILQCNWNPSPIQAKSRMMVMLGTGWLTIRQAQEALKNGRLEEAHRLLGQSAAQGHKRSWELLQQLARGFVQRGEKHLHQDDAAAAWNDLMHAEQIAVAESGAGRLRQA